MKRFFFIGSISLLLFYKICSQADTAVTASTYRKAVGQMEKLDFTSARQICDQLLNELNAPDSFSLAIKIQVLQLQGSMFRHESRYEEATAAYHEALRIAKKYFPPYSREQALAYYSVTWSNEQSFDMEGWKAYLDSTAVIFKKAFAADDCWQGRIWQHRARMNYFNFGSPDTTLSHLHKASRIFEQCPGGARKGLFDIHKIYYDVYLSLRQFDSAEHYLKKQIEYTNTREGPMWDIQRAWMELTKAQLYRLDGHYEKAISHYQYAKSLFETVDKDTVPLLNCDIYTAHCLSGIGKHAEALKLYAQLHRLMNEYTKLSYDMLGLIYEGTARAYAASALCDSAINYSRRSLDAFYHLVKPDNPKLLAHYLSYGNCLSVLGKYAQADSILAFANNAAINVYGADHHLAAQIALMRSNVKTAQGEFEASQKMLDTISMLEVLKHDPQLQYQHLIGSAKILIHKNEPAVMTPAVRDNLVALLNKAMEKFRDIRNQYRTEEARSRSITSTIHELHAFVPRVVEYYSLQSDSSFFQLITQISEIHRGIILSEAMNQPEAFTIAGIPAKLQQEERNQKASLHQVQKKLDQEYARAMPKKEYIGRLLADQVHQQKNLDHLIKTFQEDYPEYYQAKFAHTTINIPDVQSKLGTDDIIVEYLIVRDDIYIIVIAKNSTHVYVTTKANDLLTKASGLTSLLLSPKEETDWREKMEESCLNLYDAFVKPFSHLLSPTTSIIIIPDRALHYFPFEILRSGPAEPGESWTEKFLIYRYPIQYQPSMHIWLQQFENKSARVKHMLSVAPDFDVNVSALASRAGWNPLFHAEEECNNIKAMWGGDLLRGQAASKSNFLRQASRSDLIHLATHAMADDRSGHFSWLAFSPSTQDSLLYIDEIYGMVLKAQMVVLSGCATGIGPLQTGEGLISLSRAFSYAGARSMITSLWPVHDKSTSIIMTSFYKYLKEGLPKDRALQKAKIDFLQNIDDPAQADPYYWAGFIAMGDMSPLTIANNQISVWIWVCVVILLLIIGWLVWKRREKRENVRNVRT